jgi:hypothetical protein
MTDIKALLAAYGNWCNNNNDNLTCKSPSELIMQSAPHADASELRVAKYDSAGFITDDLALQIDGLMLELITYSPIIGECLKRKYIKGQSPEHIAHKYLTRLKYADGSTRKVSKHKASEYLAHGEGFIEYGLNNACNSTL